MNFSLLTDDILHENTLIASRNEKAATLVLLDHLTEIELRRVYSLRGYGSLWEYVHKGLGYSESQTSERISAMRLMNQVPEVGRSLKEGKLTLTSASRFSQFLKNEIKTKDETLSLLKKIENLPTREVERVLSLASCTPIVMRDQIIQRGGSTRISFDLDEETELYLAEAQAIYGRGLNSIFKKALKKLLPNAQVLRAREAVDENNQVKKPILNQKEQALRLNMKSTTLSTSRYVPIDMKRFLSNRSQNRCEYRDPKTGFRCESRYQLEIDHIYPRAWGGKSTATNLRFLCKSHNLYAAIQRLGTETMGKYLK